MDDGVEGIEKEESYQKVVFTNRRVSVLIGRTIKTSESKYEFSKFTLGFEADISDGAPRQEATDAIFTDLMTESILREAAIRAAAKDPTILDRIVILLRKMTEKNAVEV